MSNDFPKYYDDTQALDVTLKEVAEDLASGENIVFYIDYEDGSVHFSMYYTWDFVSFSHIKGISKPLAPSYRHKFMSGHKPYNVLRFTSKEGVPKLKVSQ